MALTSLATIPIDFPSRLPNTLQEIIECANKLDEYSLVSLPCSSQEKGWGQQWGILHGTRELIKSGSALTDAYFIA